MDRNESIFHVRKTFYKPGSQPNQFILKPAANYQNECHEPKSLVSFQVEAPSYL